MNYTGEELLDLWLNSEEIYGEKLSQRDLAVKLGLNFNKMHGKIYRAQKSEARLKQERIEMKDDGNTRTFMGNSYRIKTLDDLIEACEINLEEWIIERHIINKWEVGAKVSEKEDGGSIVGGYIRDKGQLVVEPLYQVKAWLLKRYPEPIQPVISPIQLNISTRKTGTVNRSGMGRALQLTDPHFGFSRDHETGTLTPYHDRKVLASVLALIKQEDFSDIVLTGDWQDLAEVSDKFVRSPDMHNTTQPAFVEGAWFLGQIRARAPKANIYLLEGNHDFRITTAINKQVPWAFGLKKHVDGLPVLSIPNLLNVEKLDIEYVGDYPNGEVWLSDSLRFIHGHKVRAKSGATASAIVEDTQATTGFGHIHRMELATKTLFGKEGPRSVSAFSPGCLCRIDGTVPGISARMNWQQGLGIYDYDELHTAITPVPIFDGVAIYGGNHISGQDYLAQLKADTGWAF
jgi:metallophosphoesterase superfamily enzyme